MYNNILSQKKKITKIAIIHRSMMERTENEIIKKFTDLTEELNCIVCKIFSREREEIEMKRNCRLTLKLTEYVYSFIEFHSSSKSFKQN